MISAHRLPVPLVWIEHYEDGARGTPEDPASFDRTYGPQGRIIVGHDDAARAAANPEDAA